LIQHSVRPEVRSTVMSASNATPVGVFKALRGLRRPAMLLESAPGTGELARHTLLSFGKVAELVGAGSTVMLSMGESSRNFPREEVLAACRELLDCCRPFSMDADHAAFVGAYGIVSFEFAEYFEKIDPPVREPECVPELHLIVPESTIVFDHRSNEVALLSLCGQDEDLEASLQAALQSPAAPPLQEATPRSLRPVRSSMPFQEMVRLAKASIAAGDVYQIVVSQGWETAVQGDAFDAYRALRSINPSPYMFFIEMPEATLLGASPEMVCALHGGRARVRPLAGTRRRPSDPQVERQVELELQRDPKERAEHVMLVDLARNDLGRVCAAGSVRTPRTFEIERYSHVTHLVSDVEGVLESGYDGFDLFAATFPAGTVSGAPKIRAMQLIGELEGRRRGYYGGAVVRAGFDGSFESCIILRSATVRSERAELRAGAGIVADSIPEREDAECQAKATAVAVALGAQGPGESP
jgi:anthranilate synthase component I